MTRLMEQAIKRLQSVPEGQQDQVAQFVLSELAEDERWEKTTADHAGKLRSLIDGVLGDDAKGRCEPLDPERL